MNRSYWRTMSFASIVALAFVLNGCGSKESKWQGTYQSTKESATLTIQPEHKATLAMSGASSDITWEPAGDDKIIVHALIPISMFRNSDGSLRDEEGTVWKKK